MGHKLGNTMIFHLTIILALVAIGSPQRPLLGQRQLTLEPFKFITAQPPQQTFGSLSFGPTITRKESITNNLVPVQQKSKIVETVQFGPLNTTNTVVKTTKTVKFTSPITVNTFTIGLRGQPTLEDVLEQDWSNFKTIYNKVYTPQEEPLRREIFIENRQWIIDSNTKYSSGDATFALQLNAYADLLPHEFNLRLNGFNQSQPAKRVKLPTPTTFIPSANVNVPERMDWRDRSAVTSVKTQGDCMGCYAFAAAAALESHTFRKTGQLVDLSPQQIIDCSKGYGNEGCRGGLMTDAYEYVKNQPGLDTWESYPYEGQDGECRFKPETVAAYCTGFVELPEGDEKALEHAVATVGPVTVAIDASQRSFQFYRDGVYFDPNCKNRQEDMNHGVLVIGFGVEPDGKKYWLIKNSYGPQWGNGGYVKMAREAGNHCGIANSASYPLV